MTATVIDLNLKRTEKTTEFLRAATERGKAVYEAWKAAGRPHETSTDDGSVFYSFKLMDEATIHKGDPGDEA